MAIFLEITLIYDIIFLVNYPLLRYMTAMHKKQIKIEYHSLLSVGFMCTGANLKGDTSWQLQVLPIRARRPEGKRYFI